MSFCWFVNRTRLLGRTPNIADPISKTAMKAHAGQNLGTVNFFLSSKIPASRPPGIPAIFATFTNSLSKSFLELHTLDRLGPQLGEK